MRLFRMPWWCGVGCGVTMAWGGERGWGGPIMGIEGVMILYF